MLYVQLLVFVFLIWKALRKIFFGQLRQQEIEVRIYCPIFYNTNIIIICFSIILFLFLNCSIASHGEYLDCSDWDLFGFHSVSWRFISIIPISFRSTLFLKMFPLDCRRPCWLRMHNLCWYLMFLLLIVYFRELFNYRWSEVQWLAACFTCEQLVHSSAFSLSFYSLFLHLHSSNFLIWFPIHFLLSF